MVRGEMLPNNEKHPVEKQSVWRWLKRVGNFDVRGQSGFEISLWMSLLLILMIGIVAIAQLFLDEIGGQSDQNSLAKVADDLEQSLSSGADYLDGYETTIVIPETVNNKPYSLKLIGSRQGSNSFLELKMKVEDGEDLVEVRKLPSNIKPHSKIIPGEEVSIAKRDGILFVDQKMDNVKLLPTPSFMVLEESYAFYIKADDYVSVNVSDGLRIGKGFRNDGCANSGSSVIVQNDDFISIIACKSGIAQVRIYDSTGSVLRKYDVNVDSPFYFSESLPDFDFTQYTPITPSVLPEGKGDVKDATYFIRPVLPDGLVFNQATRTLQGTPSTSQPKSYYNYTIASPKTVSTSMNFSISVNAVPRFQSFTIDRMKFQQHISVGKVSIPIATGGDGELSYSMRPALPDGLTLNHGFLSGAPTTAQPARFYEYVVTDQDGDQDSITFQIAVDPLSITCKSSTYCSSNGLVEESINHTSTLHPSGLNSGSQSISASGNFLIVGSEKDDSNGMVDSGSVHVFELDSSRNTFVEKVKLYASDKHSNAGFGGSVEIESLTRTDAVLAVGSSSADNGKGAVYVFNYSESSWIQNTKLQPVGLAAGDGFGVSVSISNDRVLVGANGSDNGKGAAYIFKYNETSSGWYSETVLKPADLSTGDGFGSSVSISDGNVVVNAPRKNKVYFFQFSSSSDRWEPAGTAVPDSSFKGSGFGDSISMSLSYTLIGSSNEGRGTGAVYVYEKKDNVWNRSGKLKIGEGKQGDLFGNVVNLRGHIAGVSAPGQGAYYVFTRSEDSWGLWAKLKPHGVVKSSMFGNDASLFWPNVFLSDPGTVGRGSVYRFLIESGQCVKEVSSCGSSCSLGVCVDNNVPTFGNAVVNDMFLEYGRDVSVTLPTAVGGDGTLAYSLEKVLPDGLVFDENSRVLSGNPAQVQKSTAYSYKVKDLDDDTDVLDFAITVVEDKITSFGSQTIPDVVLLKNRRNSKPLPGAVEGDIPFSYTITPSLPTGVSFNSILRLISGTPTQIQDRTTYTYNAADVDGDVDSLNFAITIPPPINGVCGI